MTMSHDDSELLSIRDAKKRRLRKPPVVDPPQMLVDVSIPTSYREKNPKTWLVRVCVSALVQHILYTRGVVPTPVSEILIAYQQHGLEPTISVSREERATIKCGGLLHQLLLQWEELMESGLAHDIGAVLISLGQWWSRPREQYVMNFRGLGPDGQIEHDDHDAQAEGDMFLKTEQHEHALTRKLVSTFMNLIDGCEDEKVADWMARPALGASSYQLQLSVWVPRSTAEEIYQASDCETRFIVRQDFSIQNQPTTGKKAALIETQVRVDGADLAEDKWDEASGVWMSLPTTVKGFSLSK
jgi:hypothetical protein